MSKKYVRLAVVAILLVFIIGAFSFMFGGNKETKKPSNKNSVMVMPEATGISNEITRDMLIDQTFVCESSSIKEIAIVFHRIYDLHIYKDYNGNAKFTVRLKQGNEVLFEDQIKVDKIEDQHRTFFEVDEIKDTKGNEYVLEIEGDGGFNSGMTVMMQENDNDTFRFGSMPIKGTICFTIN